MKTSKLKSTRAWTSLSEAFPSACLVKDNLYKVADKLYVLAQPYDQTFLEGPNPPYVTVGYWAPTDEAAIKCAFRIHGLVDAPKVDYPEDITNGTKTTYSSVSDLIPEKSRSVSERATYDNQGHFVHKKIELKDYVFYFPNLKTTPDEQPYAIEIVLK